MARNRTEDERGSLSCLFNDGFALFSSLDTSNAATNSPGYQSDLKRAMATLEDVTRSVSSLGLFSDNEDIDEVATSDIKYFLLPALLGSLSLRQLSESRADVVRVAEVYFGDFLSRLKDYGMTDFEIPPKRDEGAGGSHGLPDLRQMTHNRNDKIKKYRLLKELDSRIADLRRSLEEGSSNVDDEITREYHLTLIRRHVQQALDDLAAIKMEMPLLEKMMQTEGGNGDAELKRPKKSNMKPIIITRDEAQKRIFGLGYPSVPTMTVDEFYEQKVKEGTFTIPDMSLQAEAVGDFDRISRKERDEIDREAEIDADDPAALRRDREWDDWKDDHRRGWGNRKNKG